MAQVYRLRGFKNFEDIMNQENQALTSLSEKMMYKPEDEPVADIDEETQQAVQPMRPEQRNIEEKKNDKLYQEQLLKKNLERFMPDREDISHFLTMVSNDRVVQLNTDWPYITRKLGKRKVITPNYLKTITDQYFSSPGYLSHDEDIV